MKKLMVLLVCLSALSCKSNKKTNTHGDAKSPKNLLMVSKSGGITGQSDSFLFLTNGKIFIFEGIASEPIFLCHISKSELEKLESLIHESEPIAPFFSEAGNINYGVTLFAEGSEIHVNWADQTLPKNKNIPILYEYAFALINACKK